MHKTTTVSYGEAHFDALIIALDTLPKEYYKLLILHIAKMCVALHTA